MQDLPQLAQELEWANYARAAYFATVVPGYEVTVTREVIFVTDREVPTVDGNHAAMLRTTPDRADALIDRIIEHYRRVGIQPYIVVSPGCTPSDLPQRLEARGFVPHGKPESWMALMDFSKEPLARIPKGVTIRRTETKDMPAFCQVLAKVYEMPDEMLPVLEHGFVPINDLPGINNYLAFVDDQPVGCISLYNYLGYSAVGSAAVLPELRYLNVIVGLFSQAYFDWREHKSKMMLLQTSLPKLEKMMTFYGFHKLFTRTYYTLPETK